MVCGKGPSIGGKIKKEAKRFGNKLKKGAKDITENALDIATVGTYSAAKKGVQKIGDMLTPEMPDILIDNGTEQEAGPQYVMPDEEEIRRARRRRGANSRSGRSATIMSGDSTETLGG